MGRRMLGISLKDRINDEIRCRSKLTEAFERKTKMELDRARGQIIRQLMDKKYRGVNFNARSPHELDGLDMCHYVLMLDSTGLQWLCCQSV